MTSPPFDIQASVFGLADKLRGLDRLAAGRHVANLAALGVLSATDGKPSPRWSDVRNAAVHYGDHESLADHLYALSREVERDHAALRNIFSHTLTPDILQAGGTLPQLVALAGMVVEQYAPARDRFEAWYDAVISLGSSAGRQTGDIQTPKNLARLMVELAEIQPGMSVLDPACGAGETLREAAQLQRSADLFGQEISALGLAIATLRLFLLRQGACLQLGDAIRAPARWPGRSATFDRVICDPPYGLAVAPGYDLQLRHQFQHVRSRRSEAWFLQLCLESLNPEGRAVILLPLGFLARKSEAAYWSELVEAGRLEGVISLPSGVIPGTDIPAALVIVRGSDSKREKVTFVDASYLIESGKRATQRLTTEQVEGLVSLYRDPGDPMRAAIVPSEDVVRQGGEVQPKAWITSPEMDWPAPSDLYRKALEAEALAASARSELDELMVLFKLRAP
ncbi:class I SAM-dependent DNA methyltransferase [Brevundimonas sp. NPDC092305]|uniref:HsdM family class I SAM-dependent methyltransferase n=1 Tax=Brevundimonas sp. NPDC092305 TaxID=3363957 RepID=UPI0037F39B58